MPILPMLLAAAPMPSALPPCRAAQLRLRADGRDGGFDGMSHVGTRLSIRNVGPDCVVAALPAVTLQGVRGHAISAARSRPIGMHLGPVMVPVRLAAGHRVATDLWWVSSPVFPRSRSVRAASVAVRIGPATLRTPLDAVLFGDVGKPVEFVQTPLRPIEGMAAG